MLLYATFKIPHSNRILFYVQFYTKIQMNIFHQNILELLKNTNGYGIYRYENTTSFLEIAHIIYLCYQILPLYWS